MSTLFTVIFIASAVGIWYFIKKKPDKKMRNIAIVTTIVSALIVGATAPDTEKKDVKPKTAQTSSSKEEEKLKKEAKKEDREENQEAELKEAKEKKRKEAEKTASEKADVENKIYTDVDSFIEHLGSTNLEITSYTVEDNTLIIEMPYQDNFTKKLRLSSGLSSIQTIWQEAAKTSFSDVDFLSVRQFVTLEDNYGKQEQMLALSSRISMDIAKKIKYENKTTDLIEEESEQFFLHPEYKPD